MHQHKHRVKSEFQCPLCSFSAKVQPTLAGHLLRDHKNVEPINAIAMKTGEAHASLNPKVYLNQLPVEILEEEQDPSWNVVDDEVSIWNTFTILFVHGNLIVFVISILQESEEESDSNHSGEEWSPQDEVVAKEMETEDVANHVINLGESEVPSDNVAPVEVLFWSPFLSFNW